MTDAGPPGGRPGVGGPAATAASTRELLLQLHAQIRGCRDCSLHLSRTQAVPGAGPSTAAVMIIGEAPGFNEDMQGRPFVGAAGKLLDTLLAGIGLSRTEVFVTNVIKCRPPQNRDPLPSEVEACSPYLAAQLELIRPQLVLLLGRHALERVLPGRGPISRVHGTVIERDEVAYMPLYHPAAALHNGGLVNELQADFDRVRQYLASRRPARAADPEPEPEPEPPAPAEQLTLL